LTPCADSWAGIALKMTSASKLKTINCLSHLIFLTLSWLPQASDKMKDMLKLVIAGLIILVLGVGAAFLITNIDFSVPTTSDKTAQSSASGQPSQTPSQYVDYYDGIITATAGQKVLFFYAPWCPQCRALETSIKAGTIPSGVTIIKTDYDSMQGLRQKYGVTIQTTLVKVNDDGDLVEKYVAYDEPTLQSVIDNLL